MSLQGELSIYACGCVICMHTFLRESDVYSSSPRFIFFSRLYSLGCHARPTNSKPSGDNIHEKLTFRQRTETGSEKETNVK